MDKFIQFMLAGFGIVAGLIALYLFLAHPDAVATEFKAMSGASVPFIAQLQGNPGH